MTPINFFIRNALLTPYSAAGCDSLESALPPPLATSDANQQRCSQRRAPPHAVAKAIANGSALRNKCLWPVAFAGIFATNVSDANLLNLQGLYATDLEETTAITVQRNYQALRAIGCSDEQAGGTESCAGEVFQTFRVVRRLVHTANDLTPESDGPTQFSMRLDLDLLSEALRWVAAEEHIEQGDMSSEFVEGQFTGLVGRINALRFGASGFSLSGIQYSNPNPSEQPIIWGGAAGDAGASFSRLSGFLNAQLSSGSQDPSGLEDAFDFTGIQLNGGLDYRLNDRWVVGATLGYADQGIDFDRSKSVADGEIDTNGFSIMPFVLYNSDTVFGSVSVGWQSITLDSDRVIRYASANPAVESTDTRALSSTDATNISLYSTLGYSFRAGAWSFEPYGEYRFMDISIDGFSESDIANQSHSLAVSDQSVASSELAFGVSVQYVLTPSFGVVVPFFDMQVRKELEDETQVVTARYAGVDTGESFRFSGNQVDSQYFVYTLGISSVVQGGSQSRANGVSSGGLSVFANFKSYVGIDDFSHHVVAAGLRYEF
ncbi:MAG: autotransporter outer membrane beta-barrel domain-containing protein [Cellvibrionaceae bacterium]|nr:autotransporter outer membrane beta-barrel domain-containing protein [Cellvibrionaceae bacterium]